MDGECSHISNETKALPGNQETLVEVVTKGNFGSKGIFKFPLGIDQCFVEV